MSLAEFSPHDAGTAEPAPAKINLALHVTGRRPDGFHALDTLAVFTRLGDRLALTPAASDRFTVSGPFARNVPVSADNLVLRAADAFFRQSGTRPPLAIALEKVLPVASGVGGGSSDAAATLRALARLFRPQTSQAELAALALPLGADLPMCLAACPLLARGIGEVLTPLPRFPSLAVVLVNPGVPVSTPLVFAALRLRENPPLPPLPHAPDGSALLEWLRRTRNDLQPPAVLAAPAIGEAVAALEQAGASLARMSGSGATCFGLFASSAQAERAAAAIARARPAWWTAATVTLPSPESAAP